VSHRGSGRGPTTVADASHLDAADAAKAVALRRDRLVARQRELYKYDLKRQAEIDMLSEVWRLYRAFDDARRLPAPMSMPTPDREMQRLVFEDTIARHRHRHRQSDIGG
jgi:hypothetical protein